MGVVLIVECYLFYWKHKSLLERSHMSKSHEMQVVAGTVGKRSLEHLFCQEGLSDFISKAMAEYFHSLGEKSLKNLASFEISERDFSDETCASG